MTPFPSHILRVTTLQPEAMPSAIARACEGIIQHGISECATILHGVITNTQRGFDAQNTKITQRLFAAAKRLTDEIEKRNAPALPNNAIKKMNTAYTTIKADARERHTQSTDNREKIQDATRTVASLCFQCHMMAMQLLPALKPAPPTKTTNPNGSAQRSEEIDLLADWSADLREDPASNSSQSTEDLGMEFKFDEEDPTNDDSSDDLPTPSANPQAQTPKKEQWKK